MSVDFNCRNYIWFHNVVEFWLNLIFIKTMGNYIAPLNKLTDSLTGKMRFSFSWGINTRYREWLIHVTNMFEYDKMVNSTTVFCLKEEYVVWQFSCSNYTFFLNPFQMDIFIEDLKVLSADDINTVLWPHLRSLLNKQ